MDALHQAEEILFAHTEYHRCELLRAAEEDRMSHLCQQTSWFENFVAWLKRQRMKEIPQPIKPAVSRQ